MTNKSLPERLEQESQKELEALVRKIANCKDPVAALTLSISPLKRWRNAYAKRKLVSIEADLKGLVGERLTLAEYAKTKGEEPDVDNTYQLGQKLAYNEAIDHALAAIEKYCRGKDA